MTNEAETVTVPTEQGDAVGRCVMEIVTVETDDEAVQKVFAKLNNFVELHFEASRRFNSIAAESVPWAIESEGERAITAFYVAHCAYRIAKRLKRVLGVAVQLYPNGSPRVAVIEELQEAAAEYLDNILSDQKGPSGSTNAINNALSACELRARAQVYRAMLVYMESLKEGG